MLQELNSYNTDDKTHMPKTLSDPTESLLTPVVKAVHYFQTKRFYPMPVKLPAGEMMSIQTYYKAIIMEKLYNCTKQIQIIENKVRNKYDNSACKIAFQNHE